MAILLVTEGPAKDQTFTLAGCRVALIGREAACTFQIVDPELSRAHLQIREAEDQDRHFAKDFQSKNGVLVNGKRIQDETPLNDGDVISIGQTVMIYLRADASDAQSAFESWKKRGQGHVSTRVRD
jgi:pSer/pThr/pTyr-binding forkhead associated (FHA) protein